MFRPVDPKRDFIQLEHEILEFWRREAIFDQLREQVAGGPKWSFIDGPITANNPMGVHHAWGRTYKDVFQRHRAMNGFDQRWQNGFDCQGLWLEVETERELGFNSKKDIEEFGLDNFSRACRARVEKFSKVQTEQSIRLGQWMRWDDSYYTMTDRNIEYIWHFLEKTHEKGWLYRAARSMPWCTRCGTSLSQHELADGYDDTIDESVYLRFPLLDESGEQGSVRESGESLLVWTTTPWTLPANVAAAVNPELDYVKVRQGEHVYYASAGTREKLFKKEGEVLETVKGAALVGRRYLGPYDDLPAANEAAAAHQVIAWSEVGETDGTGIVHIAPGCGAEDFQLGKDLGLPLIAPIDGAGIYEPGFGFLTGQDVHHVEKSVLQDLKQKGLFFRQESYKHRYPFCWRCKEKLVFRIEREWFIRCDEIRPLMMAQAEQVRWIPESVGKRTKDWYTNMGDWCISRKRYWGLPLPFYFTDDGELVVVGSRERLRELAVDPAKVDALPELHRPWIDEIEIVSPVSGKIARRVKDVGDCWLDAGIVCFSTLGYLEDRAQWERWYPAEFVCEMREQVRLWFYAMMFAAVTLDGRAPYRTVLSHEKVYDEKGKPMHKSSGNAIWFDVAVEKMGADVMRWLYCGYNPSMNLRFGYKAADDVRRKILTLWNVYGFFVTYAELDGFDPTTDPIEETLGQSVNPLDRWILSELHQLAADLGRGLEEFDTLSAVRRTEEFIDGLSTWYVRRSRRRCWKSSADLDKAFTYRTLHHVLLTLVELLAPITPFLSEEIYRNLSAGQREKERIESESAGADAPRARLWPESVHLRPYPKPRFELIDAELNTRIERLLAAVRLGRSAREKVQIKVRQPLPRIWVLNPRAASADPSERVLADDLLGDLAEELNVREVLTTGDLSRLTDRHVKLNFPVLGARLGEEMKEVARLAKAGEWRIDGERNLIVGHERLSPEEYELTYEGRDGLVAAGGRDLVVILDPTVSDDLRREGYAREIVRAIQELRKQANYRVDQRIVVFLLTEDPRVGEVTLAHGEYIRRETLADRLDLASARESTAGALSFDQQQEVEVDDGLVVIVGVRRVESQERPAAERNR